jgi:hypothetical protein
VPVSARPSRSTPACANSNPARTSAGSPSAPGPPLARCATSCSPRSTWPANRHVTPGEFDRLLKTALAEHPRTFLVDEAQWLNGEAFEYFRYLWDEPATQLAIIFVGGAGCHTVLRREPMLSSRVFIWQQFTRLTSEEVIEVTPLFHPVWADADLGDITFADQHAAHGNFRAWAQLTAHVRTALARTGRSRVDRDLLRWAFSRLA